VRFGAPRRRELVATKLTVAGERLRSLFGRRRLELGARERALAALSPRCVLERGYSITTRAGDASALRDAAGVTAGEHLVTTLARGELRSLVLGRGGAQGSLFEEPGARDQGLGDRRRGSGDR
jgi:exonuclease VII large subunit